MIYMFMWLEEQFPYYELNFDNANIKYNLYNIKIQKGIAEWLEMKEKRENGEISTAEYIEWKLHYEITE